MVILVKLSETFEVHKAPLKLALRETEIQAIWKVVSHAKPHTDSNLHFLKILVINTPEGTKLLIHA